MERVQKFFACVPEVLGVFVRTPWNRPRRLAQDLAQAAGLQLGISELGLLVDSLAGDGQAASFRRSEKLSPVRGRNSKS